MGGLARLRRSRLARLNCLLALWRSLMAARARCGAYPQPLSLENSEPWDDPDSVLRNRLSDDRHIEAHIFARHLVEIDDLKRPAAPDKCVGAVIAGNADRLKR